MQLNLRVFHVYYKKFLVSTLFSHLPLPLIQSKAIMYAISITYRRTCKHKRNINNIILSLVCIYLKLEKLLNLQLRNFWTARINSNTVKELFWTARINNFELVLGLSLASFMITFISRSILHNNK